MAIVEEHVGDGRSTEAFGIWEQFTVRDGLPDMKIESLFEGSDGAMWIGTHDRGVVRYDGYGFETFSRGDGVGGDGVFSILQDPEGNMWFGTNTGITRYDGDSFEHIEIEETCGFMWGSCVDGDGNLWFGLERRPGRPAAVCRWDGQRAEVIEVGNRIRREGFSIHTVVADGEGGILCGGHGLYRLSGGRSKELGVDSNLRDVTKLFILDEKFILLVLWAGVFRARLSDRFELEGVFETGHACGAAQCPDNTYWIAA